MSHEVETMAYFGDMPWHKLGTPLTEDDAFSSETVLKKSGLDWEVNLRNLYFTSGETETAEGAELHSSEEFRGIVRADTNELFSVVSAGYGIIQNKEAFAIFDPAVKEGLLRYETAISLFGGRKVVITATVPGMIKVKGDESPVRKYLLLHTGHTGTDGCGVLRVPTRVVCKNTLNIALGQKKVGTSWNIRHSKNASQLLASAGAVIHEAVKSFEFWEAEANVLAEMPFTETQMKELAAQLFTVRTVEEARAKGAKTKGAVEKMLVVTAQQVRKQAEVMNLFENGKGHAGIRGTAWAAINAIAEWADHLSPTRGGETEATRFASNMFGTSSNVKDQASTIIRQLVGA